MTVLLLLCLAQAGTERKQIENGVLAAARHIVRGVENNRAEDILAHVSPEGAPCIDSVITRQQYESDLQSKGNYIHAYFFDATEFNERFRSAIDPISLAELVARGGELSCRVHFQRFPGSPPYSSPCVDIISKELRMKRTLFFYQKEADWVLRDGLNCG
jgi:hypothetical protein